MAVQWNQNLATGIDWQDKEHMELFNRINKLIDSMAQGKGKEEIKSTADFLDSYVAKHFGKEEQVMARGQYPEASSHKNQHDLFASDIQKLKKELEKGATLNLVVQTQVRLGDWLKNHIGSVDQRLASFLKTKTM